MPFLGTMCRHRSQVRLAKDQRTSGLNTSAVEDLVFVTSWRKVHGGGTSDQEGYVLGTLLGSDGKYHAALFTCTKKKLVGEPWTIQLCANY